MIAFTLDGIVLLIYFCTFQCTAGGNQKAMGCNGGIHQKNYRLLLNMETGLKNILLSTFLKLSTILFSSGLGGYNVQSTPFNPSFINLE